MGNVNNRYGSTGGGGKRCYKNRNNNYNYNNTTPSQHRYVEFMVCLQNVTSNYGDIRLDILRSKLHLADGIEHCMYYHDDDDDDDDDNNNNNPTSGQLLSPRIIYKSWDKKEKNQTNDDDDDNNDNDNDNVSRKNKNKKIKVRNN